MAMKADKQPQLWSSRTSFVLAASGFAVGLGNIWRFPYMTGENGGAAFILVYLACVLCIGLPLVMAELMLGRRGGRGIVGSLRNVAAQSGASRRWHMIGILALIATFAILAYYVVIAGWTLDYMLRFAGDEFSDAQAEETTAIFASLMDSPWRMIGWMAATVAFSALVISRGLTGGIEKLTNIIMPFFFAGLVLLAIYAAFVGDMMSALQFLFVPDFSKIDGGVIAMAVGQAFFSVGVGFGTMVSFGSHLDRNAPIAGSAMTVIAADTVVALLAGLTIFPFVFQYGVPVTSGPGLVFETLPIAFGAIPGGSIVGFLFFLLLFIAAITSCVGLLEPLGGRIANALRIGLRPAVFLVSLLVGIASLGTVFSFNHLAEFHPLEPFGVLREQTIYVVQDYLAVNIVLPLGALLTSLFVGWVVKPEIWREELATSGALARALWRPAMRYAVPLAILAIMIAAHWQ
ncbi:sodium-dependent transporter [Pacificimonas sp. WHA3]|uniref:Transporter n=1 Tax=Pacificimonas pallii TaxID=2827236 RepID=A0ABS6SD74_9SPHN|nr:sodium-dependent transporter [Pacificimonas pallii]MBV7255856.1 sodium-dependent transporter [Pacificimonas pallii]